MILKCFFGLILLYYGVVSSPTPSPTPKKLLGAKECTWGPTYWCQNITAAKSCGAVRHCIQTVWQHQNLPEDNDDICQICKNMVQTARDQLESNETMDEIKEVFEGSCKLMYLKPAVKLCIKLADELVPELVDTLSSQMNPQVVCSVAGLCNNAAIDRMIEDHNKQKTKDDERVKELQPNCEACLEVADVVEKKLEAADLEDVKVFLLERCRSLGSYTDACSNIVMTHVNSFYDQLKNHFTSRGFCHLTGSCIGNYTRKVQIKTESDAGVVLAHSDALSVTVKHVRDETCDLCKQLVKHLKDILVADTTEDEFRLVLRGICKQTNKFKDECLSIVDEYYDRIYQFIVDDLNGAEICSLAGICARPGVYMNGPIWPLLPPAPIPMPEKTDEKVVHVQVNSKDVNVRVMQQEPPKKVEIAYGDVLDVQQAQLPIDRILIPQHKDLAINNQQICLFCQYFLHYVQKAITQPYGENEVKSLVDKVCDELPQSLDVQCRNFVDIYGDAFVAILAQQIDPSQVCPSLHVCPAKELENRYEPLEITGKPGCPLCLMAVEELVEKLKDNKTEDSVKSALDSLCTELPKSLQGQCVDLVKQYTEELIDMIVADFTPQEVCTYLKLCPASLDVELVPPVTSDSYEILSNDILTNEIPDYNPMDYSKTLISVQMRESPSCVLCEFVMDKIDEKLRENATEEDIRRTVQTVCRALPKTVRSDCNDFVNKYSDVVVKLLGELLDPTDICSALKLCLEREEPLSKEMLQRLHRAVQECAMCEAIVGAVDALLEDKQIDRNITRYMSKVCQTLPSGKQDQCKMMLEAYGPSIINLLVDLGVRPNAVCSRIGLCDDAQQMKVDMSDEDQEDEDENEPQPSPKETLIGNNRCTWGPSYWCQSEHHANSCGTLAHCREIVWKADRPPQ